MCPLAPGAPSNTCLFQLLSTRLKTKTPAPQPDHTVDGYLIFMSDRTFRFVAFEKDIRKGDSFFLLTRKASRDWTHSYLRASFSKQGFLPDVESRDTLRIPT